MAVTGISIARREAPHAALFGPFISIEYRLDNAK